MTSIPRLVIFDNDGVLVDSERLTSQVLADMLTTEGLPSTFDDVVHRYLGRRTSDCLAEVEQRLGRPLAPNFVSTFDDSCSRAMRELLQPMPGVNTMLDTLEQAGVAMCVASSGTPKEIDLRLTVTGLKTRFNDDVFSGVQVRHGKPAPDLFLFAAERMNCPASEAVVVEDSPAGITGAKAAGMRVIGHANLLPATRLHEAGADTVVAKLDEVPALLGV